MGIWLNSSWVTDHTIELSKAFIHLKEQIEPITTKILNHEDYSTEERRRYMHLRLEVLEVGEKLSDALLDAGCDDEDLIKRLRDPKSMYFVFPCLLTWMDVVDIAKCGNPQHRREVEEFWKALNGSPDNGESKPVCSSDGYG